MSLIDLKCQESICFLKDCCYINRENENLLLGQCGQCHCVYLIYLYFDLLPCSIFKNLKQARLILFKLPLKCLKHQICNRNQCDKYSIFPLLDFFNIYSMPDIKYSQVVNFEDKDFCSYTEVDITYIVKAWIEEKIENKGLLLAGKEDARIIRYASDRYRIKGMRPRLRLIYEENCISRSLTMTPCTVKVSN